MITDLISTEVKDICLWSQQEGAPCQTAHQTIYILQTKFGNRVIRRLDDVKGPLWTFSCGVPLKTDVMRLIQKRLIHAINEKIVHS